MRFVIAVKFLADHTNGRAYATVLPWRPSVVVCL